MQKIIKLSTFVIIVVMLFVVLAPVIGYAECSGPYMSSTAAANLTFTDTSLWAISNNQLIIGKKSPDEIVPVLLPQCPMHKFIRGGVETGVIREKAVMHVLIGETICGLTDFNVPVTIKAQYKEAVEAIVLNKLGEEGLSAKKIISCTQVWENDTVYHIFFTSKIETVVVGYVTANNGQDVILIYMGDFDGDGSLELGFTAGWNTAKPTPPPTTPSKQPCSAAKKNCGKKFCIQINIFSVVNNCFRFLCD